MEQKAHQKKDCPNPWRKKNRGVSAKDTLAYASGPNFRDEVKFQNPFSHKNKKNQFSNLQIGNYCQA